MEKFYKNGSLQKCSVKRLIGVSFAVLAASHRHGVENFAMCEFELDFMFRRLF